MKPSLSIITPVKARHPSHVRWMREAVESVQGQSRDDWEMVIVDDHSSISLPAFEDQRVKMFSLAGNESGVSAARNEAARLATSDLLLPLDADDKFAENAVEAFLGAWKGEGIIYSDVVMWGTDYAKVMLAPTYDFNLLLQKTFMLVGCLHKKADWKRAGGWRVDMQAGLEDWEYWITLGEMGVCGARVPEPLYWYRRQPGGRLAHLKSKPENWHRAYNRMRELHIDTFNGRRPMGCCGGSARRVAGVVNRSKPLAKTPTVQGERDLVIYTGGRRGGFGMRGQATGVRYQVPGVGDFVVDMNGRPGVDKRDTQVFLRMNRGGDFSIVTPPAAPKAKPRPQPVPAPRTPESSTAWKPAPMESEPVETLDTHAPDPATMTVREIKALILSRFTALQMLAEEKDGKARSSVIKYLERMSS